MAKAATIPTDLIPKFELWGRLTAEIFGEMRQREGLVPDGVPKDQRWFWSKTWQKKEREADEDIANGDVIKFDNIGDAIKYLNKQA